jgi:quercetin dioxygenase-like cupin family protein
MNRSIQRILVGGKILSHTVPTLLLPGLLGVALAGASPIAGATGPNAGWHADNPPARAYFEHIRVHSKVADSDDDAFVVIRSNEPSDVYVNHVIADPLGNSGWHTHPGPSVVVVKSGTATVYEVEGTDCVQHTYPAGTGFVDAGGTHVHLVSNASTTEPMELYAFQIIPTGLARVIPVADPGLCPGL